ncbi:hypothetical protein CRENPOLYSF2_390003 [Crenothrix polyspora]|uniref:Uncharacterized protein n=1 Tax=Crenothrix polyspora TaxID=360316 RepID=A0A1R4HDJ5_9GAMM|nr:hypothetical protein CRENPOLYSF2_390003 [Crenothrix polyspora]
MNAFAYFFKNKLHIRLKTLHLADIAMTSGVFRLMLIHQTPW